MTEQVEEEKVREFVRAFHAKYEKESIISDICDVIIYQEDYSKTFGSIGNWTFADRRDPRSKGHSSLDYIQIGTRSKIPVSILNSDHPLEVIRSFTRSLRLGERNYVLSQLSEKADDGDIDTIEFEQPSFENLQHWCENIDNPDHLFLPLDSDFHSQVFDWGQNNNYLFDYGEVTAVGSNIIRIHWVPLDSGFQNGYLISSDGLTTIQKWFGDAPNPSGISYDSMYDKLSLNRPLMVYIGDEIIYDEDEDTEGFENKVEFLYRVVLSNLMVDTGHAIRLNPTKELSSN